MNLNIRYEEGVCEHLDKKIRDYEKVRIWHGKAVNYAFTEEEVDTLAKLWRKAKMSRKLMTFREVSTLMVRFF